MLGLLRGVVRGAVAWLVGWALTFAAVVVGVVDRSGVDGAAAAYVRAHAVPPEATAGVAIPVVAVGVAGLRAGRSTRSGVTGRVRSLVQSVRGTERNRAKTAAVAGGLLAVGYAVVGVALSLVVGGAVGGALVGGIAYGLAVGVPTAVVGAFY
ncbi:hypothetical protein [Natronomonas marina]|jgi:hypothetical protein|uniref:hypothetical protein n=1 Tax=Natronomonas marina TaxID=2961939 RepID=UPI0020C957C9|nr:hypothetical protein [Natronomonas marina]